MDKSCPIEAEPLEIVRPVIVDEDHNQTEATSSPPPPMVTPFLTVIPISGFGGVSYETQSTPLLMDRPFTESGDVSDETQNTSTPLPLMVTPIRTITPYYNEDSLAANAGPSTGPVKRGRGRPKGSKNLKMSMKKQKTYAPNSKVVTSCLNFVSGITEAERETGNQELVGSIMSRFDGVRRRLCQVEGVKGVLTTAITNCRNLGVRTNMKKRIGPVPGIEVGDIFYFWGEMCLVGLHTQMVAGIDYLTVKDGATEGPLATSVVTSGHYSDETEDLETLIYTGHGGTDKNGQASDQKLERGNLALEASKKKGNEVRVIRGEEDPNDKKKKIYIYDGLYLVSDYWKERGKSGFEEYKFRLVRKPGQPSGYANWKSAERWRKCGSDNSRKGFILQDLSSGYEGSYPVPLVNEIDENDKKNIPEYFSYSITPTSTNLTLGLGHRSIGCSNCPDRLCSTHADPMCYCVQRNGGELPYHDRILVCRKPMVYECGDPCNCLLDCKNRVTQTGLKIRVEVFKTEKCGWGLRSLEPIRAGTFICVFVGMTTLKHEVEEDDEYVFDASLVCNPFKWNYEPELVGEDCWEQVSEVYNLPWPIVISARRSGNVSRFMNHSCSPNVMWQPVEIEQNRESTVRIAFFALKHITPMTELRYDYGMSCVAQEGGEDGTGVFKGNKVCLCGSVKCRGSFG